ncbi:MAG: ImmA/IrrE family metallo-endopeptidase [Gallionella sp.]|nr:ImmA/IrrE family metallo-endopeptidase [Gallionella sp.]
MALNLKVLSQRLRQAREVLGYSVEDVCKNIGIDPARLLGIELAKQKPSGDEVLILASFYDCDFRAFLDETLPSPVETSDILFRRFGKAFTANDRRAIQQFLHLCVIEMELENALNEQKKSFSLKPSGTHYKTHGLQAAEALRSQLGYRDIEAPRDIYADFRSIGIHIFRRRLSNAEISGLYVEHPVAGHCVLVNYDEDIYRQRFSVAHEVAHAIFDSAEGVAVTYQASSSKYNKNDYQEIRANSFASCYLMPPSMLNKLPRIDRSSAQHWAQQFRVSTAALAKALKDAGLVDESGARAIRSVRVSADNKIDPEAPLSLSALQRDKRLALLEHGLSDYYVGLCLEAHYRNLISTGRLTEALGVDAAELSEVATLYGRTIGYGA